MDKKKGRDNNSDWFIGLLILLAIIAVVIHFIDQIMIVVAVIAAIAICVKLFQFFRGEDAEPVTNKKVSEEMPADSKQDEE